MLGRGVSTINRYAKDGRLPTAQRLDGPTGARLYRRADVEALAAQLADDDQRCAACGRRERQKRRRERPDGAAA